MACKCLTLISIPGQPPAVSDGFLSISLEDLILYYERPLQVNFKISNHLFLQYILCLTPNLFKTFQECQHYLDTNLSLN